MTQFAIDLGNNDKLVLRETWTVPALHALIEKNLDRLRQWERWAQGPQTEEGLAAFTTHQMHQWVDGQALPAAIVSQGHVVGSIGARIDSYIGVADLGYWIDADAEGRGLVTRAALALIDHLHHDRGIRRIEIRTAVENVRSRAVAERLGFTHEGTLTAAHIAGDRVHDTAVYGLVPSHRAD